MLMDSVFEKLSKNETLTDLERSEYLQFMSRVQTSVMRNEAQTDDLGNTRLTTPSIQTPRWINSPLHCISANMQVDYTVTDNAVDQFITFDNTVARGEVFSLHTDNQKILVLTPGDYFVGMIGRMIWTANATGYRVLELLAYDENDVLLGTVSLAVSGGETTSGQPNYKSFGIMFTPDFFSGLKYFKLRAFQNSGGNLDLLTVNFGVFVC